MSEVKPDAPTHLSFVSLPFRVEANWLSAAGGGDHSAVYLHTGLGMACADRPDADGGGMADPETVQRMEVTVWL